MFHSRVEWGRVPHMADVGFWSIATADPGRLAVVEPDGTEVTAGELHAGANRLVHALRALGLQRGDCIATVLDNGAAMLRAFLAAHQAGWYLVPINKHLTAAEIAYILEDSEASVVITAVRHAATVAEAAQAADLPAGARFVSGGAAPGFRELDALIAEQPATPPAPRQAGATMTYTSGTTGKPKGVRRPLPEAPPET